MELKACIFDLDGVIVDTARYHYLAWKRLANELGFEFSVIENESLKGVSRMTSLDILLDIGNITVSKEIKIELANKKNRWFVDYIMSMTPDEIFPGIKTFINELKNENIKIILGSASKNAKTILQKINIIHLFDYIVDGNMVKHAKPDPEVFLKGAEGAEVLPSHCIVFEDAIAGVQAAHNAGMKCIGVGDPQILNTAEMVIKDFNNISTKTVIDLN